MQLEISKVNEILTQAYKITLGYNKDQFYGVPPEWKFIQGVADKYWKEEEQGIEGEYNCIFKVEDLFVKLTFFTNSYGQRLEFNQVQFVKPITKTVEDYESI